MKYFVFLVALLLGCSTEAPCFETQEMLTGVPDQVDTVVLFDPDTFEATCYITRFYREEVEPDSTIVRDDVSIRYAQVDECWKIISIRRPMSCAGAGVQ